MKEDLKAWCQTTHAECLAQIAVFEPDGRDALRQDPSVRETLEAVAKAGLTEEAQQHAESALLPDALIKLCCLSRVHVMQTNGMCKLLFNESTSR